MALFQHLELEKPDTPSRNGLLQNLKTLLLAAWARTTRRLRIVAVAVLFTTLTLWFSSSALDVRLPHVSLDYHYRQQATKFNSSRLALLIENRPSPVLSPLMLHFISVVPPDWTFRFMGSPTSVAHLNSSVAIRAHVATGKLQLTHIPANMTTNSQEEISRFLTNLWLWESVLAPAEHVLVFQTDSILCANSRRTLNDFLDYDYVGAPWAADARFGGNGGLSLRRRSAVVDVLRHQLRRNGSEPEDVWITDRLGHRPGAKLADGRVSAVFSGEGVHGEKVALDHHANGTVGMLRNSTVVGGGHLWNATALPDAGKNVEGLDNWREGFYEPMGYHTGGSGSILPSAVWGSPEQRQHIWDYCPEIKMTLAMEPVQFIPVSCNGVWKRDGEGEEGGQMDVEPRGYATEMIDGVEYPVLPGMMPWL
ncbi:hypothetical protein QBC39DRAFT_421801 [Podospora conica]|nr:hypothetical protein QBC39DRAFT_421801 [Schizothecium conicum]